MKRVLYLVFLIVLLLSFGSFYLTGFLVSDSSTGGLSIGIEDGISVIYDEFKAQGETTDFLSLSDIELQNISNMVLEVSSYGKVYFSEAVNLTENVFNNTIDLDSNMGIGENYIFINTTSLTSLDKSAILYFYDVSFITPVIYRDGAECSVLYCQELSYVDGTFIFNVTSFSNYSLVEGYVPPEVPSTGGGGGGGAPRVELESSFALDTDLIRVSALQGETVREVVNIINDGEEDLVLEISFSDSLKKFLFLSNNRVILEAGESEDIALNFLILENEISDAYLGIIEIKTGALIKNINVLIEVKEREPIFDVLVDVPERIFYGERILGDIEIINFGTLNNIDLVLYYAVKDFEGNTLSFKEESLFINERLDLKKELSFPRYSTGQYVFYAKVSYGNITAFGTDSFIVVESKSFIIWIVVIVVLILIILVLIYHRRKNKERILREKVFKPMFKGN